MRPKSYLGHLRTALRTRDIRNVRRALAGRPFAFLTIRENAPGPRARRPWMDDPEWRSSDQEPLPHVVVFTPDHRADLPVWGINWDEPNLPRELLVRLSEWQDTFDDHFDPQSGWDSEAVKGAWAADGLALQAELQEAMGPGGTVEADWWPLEAGKHTSSRPRPLGR